MMNCSTSVLKHLAGTPVLQRDLDLYKAIIDGYYMSGKDFGEMNQI